MTPAQIVREQIAITRELTALGILRNAEEVIVITEYISRKLADQREACAVTIEALDPPNGNWSHLIDKAEAVNAILMRGN